MNGLNQISNLDEIVKNTKNFTAYFSSLDNSLSNIKDIFSVYLNYFSNLHREVFITNNISFPTKIFM